MITQAIEKAFDKLHSRTIRLPWIGPAGQHWELEIRPHDNSDYQKALAASGIKPLGTAARRPKIDDEEEKQGDLLAAVMAGTKEGGLGSALEKIRAKADARKARKEKWDAEVTDIIALQFPWESYDVGYTLAEAATMAPHVRRHLIVAGWEVSHDGNVRREMSDEELDRTLASTTIIPNVVEVTISNGSKGPVRRQEEVYPLRGKPEGAAVAGIVLRESVKAHLFMERIVPLVTDSGSVPPVEGTSPPPPTSEPEPPPDSPPAFTAVP